MSFLNEESVIVENTRELYRVLDVWGLDFEIIAVDDGSEDQSFYRLQHAFKSSPRVIPVHNERNFGKGWGLKTAFEFSSGELILFLDADLELSPQHLPNFLRIMENTKADVVIGSKMHSDSELYYPLKRRVMSKIFYFMTKILFGLPVQDTQTGIKLFTRKALEDALPRLLVKRFAFDIELLVILVSRGFHIASAPIELNFTRAAAGRIRLPAVFNMIWDTFAVFYRFRLLRFYERPMGKNIPFHYTVIAFSNRCDENEKRNLSSFLKQSYTKINFIHCGPNDMGISDKRLRYVPSESKNYSDRLKLILDNIGLECDYAVFFSLDGNIDTRFFYASGRILSLPKIGAASGYTTLRRNHGVFELLSFSVFRSVFYNMSLSYRYKPRSPRFTDELPLHGLFVKSEHLMSLPAPKFKSERLEHRIAREVKTKGERLYYSPDFMVYLRFPTDFREHRKWVCEHARGRSTYHWTLILVSSFFIIATLGLSVLAVIFKEWLYTLPILLYFALILLSRIWFYGFVTGTKSLALMMVSQFFYLRYFLFGRRK